MMVNAVVTVVGGEGASHGDAIDRKNEEIQIASEVRAR
jgi:hypothetical protein